MGTLPDAEAAELRRDIDALPGEIANGVCPSRVVKAQNTWKIWTKFCESINQDPGLSGFEDPVPALLLFARGGRLAPKGNQVSARRAEEAVRQVGQAFSSVGASHGSTQSARSWTSASNKT